MVLIGHGSFSKPVSGFIRHLITRVTKPIKNLTSTLEIFQQAASRPGVASQFSVYHKDLFGLIACQSRFCHSGANPDRPSRSDIWNHHSLLTSTFSRSTTCGFLVALRNYWGFGTFSSVFSMLRLRKALLVVTSGVPSMANRIQRSVRLPFEQLLHPGLKASLLDRPLARRARQWVAPDRAERIYEDAVVARGAKVMRRRHSETIPLRIAKWLGTAIRVADAIT
jgi:hypothetical protein